MKGLYIILISFIIMALLVISITTLFEIASRSGGVSGSEVHECLTWKSWEDRPGFYLREWQKMQCDHHGIEIDAPVE